MNLCAPCITRQRHVAPRGEPTYPLGVCASCGRPAACWDVRAHFVGPRVQVRLPVALLEWVTSEWPGMPVSEAIRSELERSRRLVRKMEEWGHSKNS